MPHLLLLFTTTSADFFQRSALAFDFLDFISWYWIIFFAKVKERLQTKSESKLSKMMFRFELNLLCWLTYKNLTAQT